MVEKFNDKGAKNGNFNNQMEFQKKSNGLSRQNGLHGHIGPK
jgi:hypothetical protein